MAIAAMRQRLIEHLPAHSLRGRLARGAFWSMAGAIISQGLGGATAILVARVLGKVLYGELGMIQSTLAMFGIFAGLALGFTASKHTAEFRQTDPDRAGRILGLATLVAVISSLVVMLLVIAFADVLAVRSLHAPYLARYIRIAAPILPLMAIAGVQNGALAGFEAFKAQSLWTGVVAAVNCASMVTGALIGKVPGAIWGYLISNAAATLVYRGVLIAQCRRHGIHIHYRHAWRERKLLISFALPTMLSGMMVAPVSWAAAAMLFATPTGPAEMGIFNAANQWRNMLMYLPAIISAPLLPMMCQLYAQREHLRLARLLKRSLFLNVAAVGSVALVLAFGSHFVMRLYGPTFEGGAPTLLSILAVTVLLAAGAVVGDMLVATGAMWVAFSFNAFWAVLVLIGAYELTPRYGSLGLGLAYVFAYLVHTAIQLAYLRWRFFRLDVPEGRRETVDTIVKGEIPS